MKQTHTHTHTHTHTPSLIHTHTTDTQLLQHSFLYHSGRGPATPQLQNLVLKRKNCERHFHLPIKFEIQMRQKRLRFQVGRGRGITASLSAGGKGRTTKNYKSPTKHSKSLNEEDVTAGYPKVIGSLGGETGPGLQYSAEEPVQKEAGA